MTTPSTMSAPRASSCRSVTRVGATARQVLATAGPGRVLAAFAGAVYLKSDRGDLIWLTPGAAPMHRRGMRLAGRLPRPIVGSPYTVLQDRLLLDEATALEWSRARPWDSPELSESVRLTFRELGPYLRSVSSFLEGLPGPYGFGVLLGPIAESSPGEPRPDGVVPNSAALRLALPAIQGVAAGCRARDFVGILVHAERLLGLGEGLTPSGDDFIGGLLFGVAALQKVYAPFADFSRADLRRFLERAEGNTNLISFTLLHDHASGAASEALHGFLQGILAGRSVEAMHRLSLRVICIGHSTGWDLLAGLWTALVSVTAGTRLPPSVHSAGPRRP